MIAGIGTDIVDVRRIERLLQRFGMKFQHRILEDDEIREAAGKHPNKHLSAYLARQFAAKEAVAKALGTGMRDGVTFRGIRIYRDEQGAPVVSLADGAAAAAQRLGVTKVHVSLSDERHYALAFAVALTRDP